MQRNSWASRVASFNKQILNSDGQENFPTLAESKNSFETVNPATGEKIASYDFISSKQARQSVERSHDAYRNTWSKLGVRLRSEYFRSLAKVLREGKNEYAKLMTLEMGKPITQSYSEVEKCAWAAEIFADRAEDWLQNETVETDAKSSFISYEPFGVILSIMPWNFPFSQAFRFAIPALLAGNTTVLKHSRVCTGSALAIEKIFEKAGFPKWVFCTLLIDHETTASLVLDEDRVRGVSITGSLEAGIQVSALAGRAMKKAVLELGGSDAFIVLEDADIRAAGKGAADARLLNSGQSCINGKRFIVHRSAVKEFTEAFASEMERRKIGDPMNEKTDIGPLATAAQVQILNDQVSDALSKGGKLQTRTKEVDKRESGSYFSPSIISNASLGMRIMQEEVFGPVAPIYVVENEAEAISVANGSKFGLGASIWSHNIEKALEVGRLVESGLVTINSPVRSDPRMPFGGTKMSGLGRETGRIGMKEFVNVKSVKVY
jgi:acyl-CoA reductase-like NAD-dependent aldehyde dehydrogenase